MTYAEKRSLISPIEHYQQFFDLYCFENLEFIRFANLGPSSTTKPKELDVALGAVKSLSKRLTSLTVSLYFIDYWEEGCEVIPQMDSLLAHNRGVSMVEIISWGGKNQEKLEGAFPLLLAKKKLWVAKDWSEASQIFNS